MTLGSIDLAMAIVYNLLFEVPSQCVKFTIIQNSTIWLVFIHIFVAFKSHNPFF